MAGCRTCVPVAGTLNMGTPKGANTLCKDDRKITLVPMQSSTSMRCLKGFGGCGNVFFLGREFD